MSLAAGPESGSLPRGRRALKSGRLHADGRRCGVQRPGDSTDTSPRTTYFAWPARGNLPSTRESRDHGPSMHAVGRQRRSWTGAVPPRAPRRIASAASQDRQPLQPCGWPDAEPFRIGWQPHGRGPIKCHSRDSPRGASRPSGAGVAEREGPVGGLSPRTHGLSGGVLRNDPRRRGSPVSQCTR